MKPHRVVRALAVGAALLVGASCSHGASPAGAPTSASTPPKAPVLVTIGSGATFGLGIQLANRLIDSWPQRLFHEALPRSAVLVNASERSLTLALAASLEVPLALEEHATVVAVWLGDRDLEHNVSPATFESQLDAIVSRLRASGARVLVGNLPRAEPGAAAYNDAIVTIARRRSATVVDVAGALAATPDIGPSSLVTPKTSAEIAEAFAEAYNGS